jgi:hypothetical protein
MRIPSGTPLGPYEIIAPIEAGGMSAVYRARDPRLGRQVAIKVLPSVSTMDDALVRRFQREARATAALQHPNIVAVYDVGETEVTCTTPYGPERTRVRYIVEELVEGPSLRALIREGPVPMATFVDIALGVARGLAAAHERGLVHRDLKPENVLIDETGRPRITDFGLVHWLERETGLAAPTGAFETLTKSGYVVGTLGYMSPEQARGDPLGPPSDIFVYGILLYELLTGFSPFARDNADEAFRAVLKSKIPPVAQQAAGAPDAIVGVIERCLQKSPADRYPSASEIVRELEALRVSLAAAPRPVRSSGSRRARPETSRAAWWIATAFAALFAFAGGWVAASLRAGRPSSPAPAALPESREWKVELAAFGARDLDAVEAALSPRGDLLAFTSGAADDTDVYTLPVRGPAVPPTKVSGAEGGRAPLVTTGRRVLFASGRADAKLAIWEAPADGGEPPRVLVEEADEPALSPDESTLAYVKRRPGISELWLSRRDGLFRRRILVGAADWHLPVFTATGGALLVYDVEGGGGPTAGSAQLVFIPLTQPKALPYEEARRLDARARAVPIDGGFTWVRSFKDRSALVLTPHGRALRRLSFGAELAAFTALRDGRTALTRSDGGTPVLWRR